MTAAYAIAVSDGDLSQAAYEELRGLVVAGSACGGRLGLVVLLRQGLAAWFALWLIGSAPPRTTAQLERPPQAPRLPGEIHTDLVRVLASMVLGGSRKEIST